jgi:hypothetical protein
VDATTTLLHRVLRRKKVWQAHKDHYYQRLVRMGWSHQRTAFAEYGLMTVCASGAVSGFFLDASGRIAVLACVAVILAASMRMVDAKWAKAMNEVPRINQLRWHLRTTRRCRAARLTAYWLRFNRDSPICP